VAFLDMAAHQADLAQKVAAELQPSLAALGVALHSFVIENLSLPDELEKVLDRRIGMNLAGDLGRYTQFEAAQSLETAAANTGGAAGVGVGLGAGVAMAQTMMNAIQAPARSAPHARFCQECGRGIPRAARFCPECGKPQASQES
jgi:membrane protease subunit (stomatin/prohibitin family)